MIINKRVEQKQQHIVRQPVDLSDAARLGFAGPEVDDVFYSKRRKSSPLKMAKIQKPRQERP